MALKFALWLGGIDSILYEIRKVKLVGMEEYDHYFVRVSRKWWVDAAPELCRFCHKVLPKLQESGEESGGAIIRHNSRLEEEVWNDLQVAGFDTVISPLYKIS